MERNSTAGENALLWLCFALVALGYGCHLSYPFFGSLAQVFLGGAPAGSDELFASQCMPLLVYAAMIAGRLALGARGVEDLLHRPRLLWPSFLVVIVCYVAAYLCSLVSAAPFMGNVLSLVMGLAGAVPSMLWVEALYLLYRRMGVQYCLSAIAAAHIVNCLLYAFAGTSLAGPGITVLVTLACIALSMVCAGLMGKATQPLDSASHSSNGLFKVPAHLCYILFVLGLVWNFSSRLAGDVGLEETATLPAALAVFMFGVLASVLLVVFVMQASDALRFGGVLRWAVTLSGIAWVVLPLLVEVAPVVALVLNRSIYIVQGILVPYLIIEIAHERRLGICSVAAVCMAFYSGGFFIAQLVQFALSGLFDAETLWRVAASICIAALFAVVPLLPNRRARADTLALDGYLDDEGASQRHDKACASVAAQYTLTARETEVMGLLLKGCTRDEIAAALGISPWTAKGYISKVYEKTGVHSARALMTLVIERQG